MQFRSINGPSGLLVCLGGREVKSKEMCFEMSPKGCNWDGWTDRFGEAVLKEGLQTRNACVGLDPRNRQSDILVWSQRMGWEWYGKHEVRDKQIVFHKEFSMRQILNSFLNFTGSQWRECSSRTLQINGGDFIATRTVDSEHVEVWWGRCLQYQTKVNCNNQGNWYRSPCKWFCTMPTTLKFTRYRLKIVWSADWLR